MGLGGAALAPAPMVAKQKLETMCFITREWSRKNGFSLLKNTDFIWAWGSSHPCPPGSCAYEKKGSEEMTILSQVKACAFLWLESLRPGQE